MIMLNELLDNDKILVALIGVVAGIASATVSYLWQVRFERKKKLLEIEAERKHLFKKEIAEAVQIIMAMIQEISWVAWEVGKGHLNIDLEYLEKYNTKAKENLHTISKHLAYIAATDLAVYQSLREISQKVYDQDVKLANQLIDFVAGKVAKESFQEIKDEVLRLEKELPNSFAEQLTKIDEA